MSIQQELLNSMKIVTDAAVAKVKFDETVIAEIISQDTVDKTKYKVKYQNRELYAYANDSTKEYKEKTGVYLLLPKNEDAKKLILGEYKDETDTRTYTDKYDDMIVIASSGNKYTPNTPFVQPLGQNVLGVENYINKIGYSRFIDSNSTNPYPGEGPWYEPNALFDDILCTESTEDKSNGHGNGYRRMGGFVACSTMAEIPGLAETLEKTGYNASGHAKAVWDIEKKTFDKIVLVGSPTDSDKFWYNDRAMWCDNKNILGYGIYVGNDFDNLFTEQCLIKSYMWNGADDRKLEHFITLDSPVQGYQYLGVALLTAAYRFVRLSEIGIYNSKEIDMLFTEEDELIVYPKLKSAYDTKLNANRVSITNLDGTEYKVKSGIADPEYINPKYTEAEEQIKKQETEELPELEADLQKQINTLNNISINLEKGEDLNDSPEYIAAEKEKENLEQKIKRAKEIIVNNKGNLQDIFNKAELKDFQSISDGVVKFYIEDLTNNSTLAKDKPYDYLGLEFTIETENTEEYIGGSYSLLITVPAGQAGLTEDVLIHEINSKTFFGNPYNFEGGFGQKVVINFPSKILSLKNGAEPVKYIEVRLSQNNDFEMPKNQGGQEEVNPKASIKAYDFSMRAGYDISSFQNAEAIAYLEDEKNLHYTTNDNKRTIRALVVKQEENTNQFKAINEFNGQWFNLTKDKEATTEEKFKQAEEDYLESLEADATPLLNTSGISGVVVEKPEGLTDNAWSAYQNKVKEIEKEYRLNLETASSDLTNAINSGIIKSGYQIRWYNLMAEPKPADTDEYGGESWAYEKESENKLSCTINADNGAIKDQVKFIVLEITVPGKEASEEETKKTSETIDKEVVWPIEHIAPPEAPTATVIYESNVLEFINDSYVEPERSTDILTLELAKPNTNNFIGAYDPDSQKLIDRKNEPHQLNLILPKNVIPESLIGCTVEWIPTTTQTLLEISEETPLSVQITSDEINTASWRTFNFQLKDDFVESAINNKVQCVIKDPSGSKLYSGMIKLNIGYATQQGLNYVLRIVPSEETDVSKVETKTMITASLTKGNTAIITNKDGALVGTKFTTKPTPADSLGLSLRLYSPEKGLVDLTGNQSITWSWERNSGILKTINTKDDKGNKNIYYQAEGFDKSRTIAFDGVLDFTYASAEEKSAVNVNYYHTKGNIGIQNNIMCYILKATCNVSIPYEENAKTRTLVAYYPIPFYTPSAIMKRLGLAGQSYADNTQGVYASGLYTFSWDGEGKCLNSLNDISNYSLQVVDNDGNFHDIAQKEFKDYVGENNDVKTTYAPLGTSDYGALPTWVITSAKSGAFGNTNYKELENSTQAYERVSAYNYFVARYYDETQKKNNDNKSAKKIESYYDFYNQCDLYSFLTGTKFKLDGNQRTRWQIYDQKKGPSFENSIVDISYRDYKIKEASDTTGKTYISEGLKGRVSYRFSNEQITQGINNLELEVGNKSCTSIRGELQRITQKISDKKTQKTQIIRMFLTNLYGSYMEDGEEKFSALSDDNKTNCWITLIITFDKRNNVTVTTPGIIAVSPAIKKISTKLYLQTTDNSDIKQGILDALTPMPSDNICISCYDTKSKGIYYQVPLLCKLNVYKAGWLNDWAGGTIEMDEGKGTILAAAMGAGRKESDNSFSGVLMGEAITPSTSKKFLGLYGVNHGQRTFSLDAKTGNAILGRENGNHVKFVDGKINIKSQTFSLDSNKLIINSEASNNSIVFGYRSSVPSNPNDDNFKVKILGNGVMTLGGLTIGTKGSGYNNGVYYRMENENTDPNDNSKKIKTYSQIGFKQGTNSTNRGFYMGSYTTDPYDSADGAPAFNTTKLQDNLLFYVSYEGKLFAKNASITGEIKNTFVDITDNGITLKIGKNDTEGYITFKQDSTVIQKMGYGGTGFSDGQSIFGFSKRVWFSSSIFIKGGGIDLSVKGTGGNHIIPEAGNIVFSNGCGLTNGSQKYVYISDKGHVVLGNKKISETHIYATDEINAYLNNSLYLKLDANGISTEKKVYIIDDIRMASGKDSNGNTTFTSIREALGISNP